MGKMTVRDALLKDSCHSPCRSVHPMQRPRQPPTEARLALACMFAWGIPDVRAFALVGAPMSLLGKEAILSSCRSVVGSYTDVSRARTMGYIQKVPRAWVRSNGQNWKNKDLPRVTFPGMSLIWHSPPGRKNMG